MDYTHTEFFVQPALILVADCESIYLQDQVSL
jgi:hypothetical protein